MSDSDLLRVEGLTVRYGAGPVVHGIALGMAGATVAALLGANGAGKSSTLRAIAGLEPAQGRVLFDGQDISGWSSARRFRAGIAYVPEGRAIVTDLSVADNLTLGSYFVDAATRARRRQVVLDFFPEIANRLKAPAGLLSGGEQQMLAIGRGLMSAPRLLLLDEPSLGLAPLLVARVYERLAAIQKEKPGPRHESTADRQHLLLAAAQVSSRLRVALLEARKKLEHHVEILADTLLVVARVSAHPQIFEHKQILEDAPALGYVCNPHTHNGVG